MSALPNTHEVLLRNSHLLTGRLALVGVSDAGLLAKCSGGGVAITEHAGVYTTLTNLAGWQACFGYQLEPEQGAGQVDSAVVFVPKVRAELELRLAVARYLAKPGGALILVGEKKEGVASAARQFASVSGEAVKIDSARHCQLWTGMNEQPLTSFKLDDWVSWNRVSCAGTDLDVAGLPGIFSQAKLDDGTRMLLQTLSDQPLRAQRLLDFACGAGVIGAWLHGDGKRHNRSPVIDGVDVQAQAIFCARKTYQAAGVAGEIFASDGLAAAKGRWPAIVTNPPFHTGVKTDTSMTEQFLLQVAAHLEPGGELRLVANSFLPYEALIARYLGPVARLAEDRRFTVYQAFKARRG